MKDGRIPEEITDQDEIINLVDDMVDRLTEAVEDKFTPDEVEDFNDGTDPY